MALDIEVLPKLQILKKVQGNVLGVIELRLEDIQI